jgi:hypothetical protein
MAQTTRSAAAARSSSYFARHWRGKLSLPRSYWLNGVLLWGFGFNLLQVVAFTITVNLLSDSPTMAIVIGIAIIALALVAYIWALTGIWRSARAYRGPRVWAFLARAVIWSASWYRSRTSGPTFGFCRTSPTPTER